jgi:hypothetical protein
MFHFATNPCMLTSTRNRLILLLFLFSSFYSFAIPPTIQQEEPPASVAASFKLKFPQATNAKWTYTGDEKKEYIVSFTIDKTKLKASFDKQARWIETEKEIDPEQLPERVVLSVETQYPHEKIAKAFEIQKEKHVLYEIVLKGGDKNTVVVSKDGYFTSR